MSTTQLVLIRMDRLPDSRHWSDSLPNRIFCAPFYDGDMLAFMLRSLYIHCLKQTNYSLNKKSFNITKAWLFCQMCQKSSEKNLTHKNVPSFDVFWNTCATYQRTVGPGCFFTFPELTLLKVCHYNFTFQQSCWVILSKISQFPLRASGLLKQKDVRKLTACLNLCNENDYFVPFFHAEF